MRNLVGKRASELWGPLRKLSPEDLKAVERTYAHFHRVLRELLQELALLPEVVWLGEQGHEIRGEGEENVYRKAIYPVTELSLYREQLAELEGVQVEGLGLLEREEPPPGLLLPVVLEGVQYARLHKHASYVSQALPREQVLSRLEGLLGSTKANLKAFERYATTFDPRREKVEGEVKVLEAAVERLQGEREALLRMRTRQERVLPYIYLDTGETVKPYVRDHGLILAGPGVTLRWGDQVRRQRKDKRRLEPLVKVDRLEVYRERDWQAAKEG